jgi:hypothetical protein
VDPGSIRERPCFLCRENLYPEQRGIAFGPDWTIYANPFPILPRHLTIVHREHRPQRIEGQVEAMLGLAAELPGLVVLYNGPECGASAPDHSHLQAGSRDGLPIVRLLEAGGGLAAEIFGAKALVLRGESAGALAGPVRRAIEALSTVTGRAPEPLLNVAGWCEPDGRHTVVLFPRGRHRPAVFETGELTVSPAAIDLCGVFVVPMAEDFEKISGDDVEAVLHEVTLPQGPFLEVVARMEVG